MKPSDVHAKGIWGLELHAGFMKQFLADGLKGAVLAILDAWHIGPLFIENILRREDKLLTFLPSAFILSSFSSSIFFIFSLSFNSL